VVVTFLIVTDCAKSGENQLASHIPSIGIEQDLRIDGNEENLVPINWLGVASTGRIALLQWQDYTVRFYSESGRFLGSVGREGAGPGEFRRLVRAGWIADTLWVSDTQLRRTTFISPNLEIVRTIPDVVRPAPDDPGQPGSHLELIPYAVYADGSRLVWDIRPLDPSSSEDPNDGSAIVRISPDGQIRKQVARIPSADAGGIMFSVGAGRNAYVQIPFFPRPQWVISPHGNRVAILTNNMAAPEPYFHVLVADSAGRAIIDRSFPFEPERIPASVMDSAIAARAARADASSHADVERQLRDVAPDAYAEAEHVVVGADNRIWIGMRRRAEGTPWMVLSPDGDPVGQIVLPPRIELRAADGQHVWCVERDELDVESVVRYRLRA
jgi:hypothetical protein